MSTPITDHQQIKAWIESKKGGPALIDHPNAGADKVGLRIDFPGFVDEQELPQNTSQPTSWETFFEIFERQKLAFLPIPDAKSQSDSYRFVPR